MNEILKLNNKTISFSKPITTDKILKFESLEFRDMNFRYLTRNSYVFKKLNFSLNFGERIGIIGKTGEKSTFLDLIMGLLKPENLNSIFINNHKINDELAIHFKNTISHVPQSIFLIDGTIAENIAFGYNIEDVDMERVINAAKIANIEEMILWKI